MLLLTLCFVAFSFPLLFACLHLCASLACYCCLVLVVLQRGLLQQNPNRADLGVLLKLCLPQLRWFGVLMWPVNRHGSSWEWYIWWFARWTRYGSHPCHRPWCCKWCYCKSGWCAQYSVTTRFVLHITMLHYSVTLHTQRSSRIRASSRKKKNTRVNDFWWSICLIVLGIRMPIMNKVIKWLVSSMRYYFVTNLSTQACMFSAYNPLESNTNNDDE